MTRFTSLINICYDTLEKIWGGPRGHRLAGSLLVIVFILSLVMVEVKELVTLPEPLMAFVPKNHLAAIEATLTLLLIIEVIGLIFSLVRSVTTSVGRQLEILSLILLRNVFKQISHFGEPLVWENFPHEIGHLSANCFSALVIFAILFLFYRIKKEDVLAGDLKDKHHFILAKKLVAIGLLVLFHMILIHHVIVTLSGAHDTDPFESFYTLLIISDMLILFISMRYGHDYQIAFRNSGFAVVTVFIRISLISPPYYSALIGMGSALFALGTLFIYSYFVQNSRHMDQMPAHTDNRT